MLEGQQSDFQRRRNQRTGYVYRRGDSWFGQFRVDTAELDENGRFKRKRLTKFIAPAAGPGKVGKKRAMALFYEAELQHLHKSGPLATRTVAEFVDEVFRPQVVLRCKPSGQAHYNGMLKNHVLPDLGRFMVRDIRPQHVYNLIRAKLDCRGAAGERLSVQTIVHIRNTVSAIFRHAKRMQAYSGDLPTEGVKLPPLVHVERRPLTWQQVQALASVIGKSPADNVQLGALVIILAITGLRIGEAMGLRWKRVNLTDQPMIVDGELLPAYTLAVRENYVRGAYGTLKTRTSRRNIPLSTETWYQFSRLQQASAFVGPDDPVFAGRNSGKPLDQHNIAARFLRPAGKHAEVGAPWVSWHCLRHSAATLADQAGLSVVERQRVLGHAAESMTLHYSHAEIDRVRAKMETIGKQTVN